MAFPLGRLWAEEGQGLLKVYVLISVAIVPALVYGKLRKNFSPEHSCREFLPEPNKSL